MQRATASVDREETIPMRKLFCAQLACLTFGLSATAAAGELQGTPEPVGANDYAAAPAILYIPMEAITLVPLAACPIPQGGNDNPGLGCSDLVTEETMF